MKKVYFFVLSVFFIFFVSCSKQAECDVVGVETVYLLGELSVEDSIDNFIFENQGIIGDVLWVKTEEEWCYIIDNLMNFSLEELNIWYATAGYENGIIESMLIHDSVYNSCLEEYGALEDENALIAFENEIYSNYVDKINYEFGSYVCSYTETEVDSISGEVEYFDYFGPFYSYNILDWLCNENGYLIVGREVVKCFIGGWVIVDIDDFEKITDLTNIQDAFFMVLEGELGLDCVYCDEMPQTQMRSLVSWQFGFSEKYEDVNGEYKMSLVLYTYPVKFFSRKWQCCTMTIYNKRKNIFEHWILSRSHTDFNLNVEALDLVGLNSKNYNFEGSQYSSIIFRMKNQRKYDDYHYVYISFDGFISNWRGVSLY